MTLNFRRVLYEVLPCALILSDGQIFSNVVSAVSRTSLLLAPALRVSKLALSNSFSYCSFVINFNFSRSSLRLRFVRTNSLSAMTLLVREFTNTCLCYSCYNISSVAPKTDPDSSIALRLWTCMTGYYYYYYNNFYTLLLLLFSLIRCAFIESFFFIFGGTLD